MKILNKYYNGNYFVYIFDNGTKIRIQENNLEFIPDFPENIDMKISNRCSFGCPYCHEGSTSDGKIVNFKKWKTFLSTLTPGTEVALGGGAISEIPGILFDNLLSYIPKGVIINMTINQKELKNTYFTGYLKNLLNRKIIHGLGISYSHPDKDLEDIVLHYGKNVVVHTIAGILTEDDLNYLSSLDCKLLILGYKNFRKGLIYNEKYNISIENNKKMLENIILDLPKKFDSVSFDCLAVEQLGIKNKIPKDDWKKLYMGDDGKFTMYVDLVEGTYGKNSTAPIEERHVLDENSNISEIFKQIRNSVK